MAKRLCNFLAGFKHSASFESQCGGSCLELLSSTLKEKKMESVVIIVFI